MKIILIAFLIIFCLTVLFSLIFNREEQKKRDGMSEKERQASMKRADEAIRAQNEDYKRKYANSSAIIEICDAIREYEEAHPDVKVISVCEWGVYAGAYSDRNNTIYHFREHGLPCPDKYHGIAVVLADRLGRMAVDCGDAYHDNDHSEIRHIEKESVSKITRNWES